MTESTLPEAFIAPPETARSEPQVFSLPGIRCAGCIGKIERGLTPQVGGDVRVNLSLKRLTVTGAASADRIVTTLSDLGFEAYPLDTETLERASDAEGRRLLTRLAVAGFAMMNVMLLSVAVWSGADGATRDLFHLISALIALPVIAYSAQPFFVNAWTALSKGHLNMDVPISLAILLAAALSLSETMMSGAHAYFDAALSLTFFLLIGRYLDHRTRSTARSAAKELSALESPTAMRLEKGRAREVRIERIARGDTILVPTGGRVPVDGVLMTRNGLFDRSFLTGESAALTAEEGAAVMAGEMNIGAPIELRATAVGEDTTLRRMAALVDTAETSRNSYTALADRAARVYAPAVHLLALFAFIGWTLLDGDMRHALNVAIAVLIITCPCALGLAVPAVSTAAISRLFSAGFLVKHATALERLAEVDHAVFDKTGTLTTPEVCIPEDMGETERSVALALAQRSVHPLSKAVVASLKDDAVAPLEDIAEAPGQGVDARFNGDVVRLGRGAWLGASFDGLGLRIGDAAPLPLEAPDALRPGACEALAALDMPVEVMTGDTEAAAARLAKQLDVPVTALASPDDKVNRLLTLAEGGAHVLMVGDGLNDTAALAHAHASIAPASALDATRSAADVVMLTTDMRKLPLVLRIVRATVALSRQNFAIATLYNLIAVPIALLGYATPLAAALAMSASSITVLLNSARMRTVK